MSTGSILIWLAVVAAFIILNGLFVAAEYAVIRLRKTRVEEMIGSQVGGAKYVQALQKDIEQTIAGAQLGITLSSLIVGWMGEKAVSGALELALNAIPGFEQAHVPHWVGFVLSFMILSTFHIILGESVPKFLGIRYPESTILKLAVPFRIFCRVMSPVLSLMTVLSNLVIRLMGMENKAEEARLPSAEEFQIMVEESAKAGNLGKQESDILVRALELKALTVREVMKPKTKVDYLRHDMTLAQVMKVVVETKHGKLPVFDPVEHRVVGVLNTKDLFDVWMGRFVATNGGRLPVPVDMQHAFKLSQYVRQAHFVPDVMQASALLEEMRAKRLQMVMVSDEFGNTIGIVTLEDLVEQLVGDIWDEYDKPTADIQKIVKPQPKALAQGVAADDQKFELDTTERFRVAGGVTLFEFSKFFQTELTCDGSSTTVAGMVIEQLGRQPKIGDTVTTQGFTFKVIEKEGPSISYLEVTAAPAI